VGEWLNGALLKLQAMLRGRRRQERDVDEELSFHRDMREREYRATGLDAEAADARSRARFGSLERIREDCLEVWNIGPLDRLRLDAASATRTLRRDPGFTAFVVLTLALGVGATTTVLELRSERLLRPLPVPAPERLFFVQWTREESIAVTAARSFDGCRARGRAWYEGCATAFPTFERLREAARPVVALAAFGSRESVQVDADGGPAFVSIRYVSGSYFPVLGLSAHRGRLLRDDDDRDGAAPAVAAEQVN
jgi:hypothetical protein